MYLMLGIRSDFAYAVGMLFQFLLNSVMVYWLAMRKLFRYIKVTEDWGFFYSGDAVDLFIFKVFSDADWAGD